MVSGQPVRYTFSGISNTSNVRLDSFYFRDTLPAQVRLEQVVTGTWNFPGVYKIVYKVNGTGDYRTLADNLSTSQTYTLAASPAAWALPPMSASLRSCSYSASPRRLRPGGGPGPLLYLCQRPGCWQFFCERRGRGRRL